MAGRHPAHFGSLHADAHYRWGSVFYGYILYDTAFSIAFYRHVGSIAFLVHHSLALVCCAFGLYHGKMAVFGMFTQVSVLLPLGFWPAC